MEQLQSIEMVEFCAGGIRICSSFLGVEVEMSFNGLRLEYALEGSSNYIAWKDRMEVVLEENRLKEFKDTNISKPTTTDAQLLDAI